MNIPDYPVMPSLVSIAPPEPRRFYADLVYERIQKRINRKINAIKPDENLIAFVVLPDNSRIIVNEFGFHNPNFIIVYGIDGITGNPVEALISHTNIQILLSVEKKQDNKPKPQIGFRQDASE